MARTTLVKQMIVQTGLTPVFTAAPVDGHFIEGSGQVHLEVKNAGAVACVVTIRTPAQVDGLDIAEQIVTVPITTGVKKIGQFAPRVFNQPDGTVFVDFDQVASVTVGLFQD